MNLSSMLSSRAVNGRPVRIGLIGAGKFGSMILSQAQRIDGLHVVAAVDLNVAQARESFKRVGWAEERYGARSAGEAVKKGTTFITDDVKAMLACPEIECVIEATGHPLAGTRHALACIDFGKHIVMVNVEADVMAGADPGREGAGQGADLLHGLWGSAGRSSASLWTGCGPAALRTHGRRQGHEF